MVLWPSEKKSPHVTGICPKAIRLRVALSIALSDRIQQNTPEDVLRVSVEPYMISIES